MDDETREQMLGGTQKGKQKTRPESQKSELASRARQQNPDIVSNGVMLVSSAHPQERVDDIPLSL